MNKYNHFYVKKIESDVSRLRYSYRPTIPPVKQLTLKKVSKAEMSEASEINTISEKFTKAYESCEELLEILKHTGLLGFIPCAIISENNKLGESSFKDENPLAVLAFMARRIIEECEGDHVEEKINKHSDDGKLKIVQNILHEFTIRHQMTPGDSENPIEDLDWGYGIQIPRLFRNDEEVQYQYEMKLLKKYGDGAGQFSVVPHHISHDPEILAEILDEFPEYIYSNPEILAEIPEYICSNPEILAEILADLQDYWRDVNRK